MAVRAIREDAFKKFKSMMLDAARAHAGQGEPPGKRRARENAGILWAVNVMFYKSEQRKQLSGQEWDPDMQELRAALVAENLVLPPVDPAEEDIFPGMVRSALRRKLHGEYSDGVLQQRRDEAILWAGYRLSRLIDEVDDLDGDN